MTIRNLFLIILLSVGVATLASGQDTNLELDPVVESNEQEEKDAWDKVDSLSTLLSGVLVAGMGAIATYVYNNRQLDLQKLQQERENTIRRVETVEKFFEHLASDNQSMRRGALDAIAALGDEKLAMALAEHFGGTGSEETLKRLSRSLNDETRIRAEAALIEVEKRSPNG